MPRIRQPFVARSPNAPITKLAREKYHPRRRLSQPAARSRSRQPAPRLREVAWFQSPPFSLLRKLIGSRRTPTPRPRLPYKDDRATSLPRRKTQTERRLLQMARI